MLDISATANVAVIIGTVISSVGTMLAGVAALGGWRTSLRNEIAVAKANAQGAKNGEAIAQTAVLTTQNAVKIEEIHVQTNGMNKALIAKALVDGREHEQQMQLARETQTAVFMEVMANPNATPETKSAAAAIASRPVGYPDARIEAAARDSSPIPVAIVAETPVPVVQTPPTDTDALDALVIGQRTHDARSDARAEDVKATVTKKAL